MATAKEMRAQTSTRAQLVRPCDQVIRQQRRGVEKKKQAVRGMLWVHRAKVVQAMDRQGSRQ